MRRPDIPIERYQGHVPMPLGVYRPANVFGAFGLGSPGVPAWALGVAMYSALAVLEDRDRKLKARADALVAAAESADNPDAVLEALNASADERASIEAERASLATQISAERARRDRELAAPTIDPAQAAQAAAAITATPTPPPPTPFRSLGEQLQAVHAAAYASQQGYTIDSRLTQIQDWLGAQMAAHGATTTVGADGGFLIQTDLSNELLNEIIAAGQLVSRVSPREIGQGFNGVKFNVLDETSRATGSRYGGVRAYWPGEGGTITSSRPKVRQVEVSLEKQAALYVPTDELLADAVALESFVRPLFIEEMAFDLDDKLIRGPGAGSPLGILNAPALVSVAAEAGQAADTVVLENFDNMLVRLRPGSRPRAAWFVNQELEPQIWKLHQVIGTGGVPVFIPPSAEDDPPGGRLRGRPVIPLEQCSAPGDLGDVILADWSQYILIRKGGVQQASSIHVYFDTDETVFRWIVRVNGRPARHSSLTPYKGTATLSPFVTLQAR